jgi:hypothetical protein
MAMKETTASSASASDNDGIGIDEVTINSPSSINKNPSFDGDDESISNEMKFWLFVIFIFVHFVIIAYMKWFVIPAKTTVTTTAVSSSSFSLSKDDDDDGGGGGGGGGDNNNEEGKDNKKNN